MRIFLVHTQTIGGHQLEYLHHLYMGAVCRPHNQFIFVVPKRFEKDSRLLEWPTSDNVRIQVMEDNEEPSSNCGLLKKSLINTKTIRKYCKKYKTTDVLTVSIMEYLPFLPFLVRNVRFSGIIYRVYLYEWKEESRSKKIQDALKYLILRWFKVFHKVYVCNDSSSAQYLNRLYKTNKFQMLPDPVATMSNYEGKDIREELGIDPKKKIFLHPGSMNPYKNTIGILKSLSELEESVRDNIAVIFAGQVKDSIKKDFEILYENVGRSMQLFFFGGYLSFEELSDLFVTCDYVLIPYKVKSQSSGIVGHAARHGKPTIVIKEGIIGKMVKKWSLGILLDNSKEDSLRDQLLYLASLPHSCKIDGGSYLRCHSVELFTKALIDGNS